MLRYLLFFSLSLIASSAFAFELPQFFTPTEHDLSYYYLGAIFGPLLPGGSDILLASRLFVVYNQIAMTVSMVIIIFTVITAIFDTASEGEVLGKKGNLWMPIRMSLGMALLVPNAGTGYCMAQYLTGWLITQGIGAADAIWEQMIDYFIEGGSVRARGDDAPGKESTGQTAKDTDTVNYTYSLEDLVLINTTCVEAHNANEGRVELLGEYKIYPTYDNLYLHFGTPPNSDQPTTGNGGYECGRIIIPQRSADATMKEQEAAIYVHLFENMALGLTPVSKTLASENGHDVTTWEKHFPEYRDNASYFIDGLIGYADVLNPGEYLDSSTKSQENREENREESLEKLKREGWILAGNYYSLLMKWQDKMPTAEIWVPGSPKDFTKVVEGPDDSSENAYAEAIENAKSFHGGASGTPNNDSFFQWNPDKYQMPGFSATGQVKTGREISYEDINNRAHNAFRNGDVGHGLRQYVIAQREMAKITMTTGKDFHGGQVQRDPLLRAAKYGRYLTESAVALVMTTTPFLIGMAAAAIWSPPTSLLALSLVTTMLMIPLVYGAVAIMYAEGVMLGVFLPLIPMMHFYIGALGWMMMAVESVVAAPLIAVGIIFPETRDNILGRAEPGLMMILNLMLRPGLMIIGFGFAMMLTWIAVELLNIMFVVFSEYVVHVDDMVGPLVVTGVYAASLLVAVSKIYELINVVPDRILEWFGGKGFAVEGAAGALREAQGSAKEGGGYGRGFAGGTQSAGSAAAQFGAQHEGQAHKWSRQGSGGGGLSANGGKGGDGSGTERNNRKDE